MFICAHSPQVPGAPGTGCEAASAAPRGVATLLYAPGEDGAAVSIRGGVPWGCAFLRGCGMWLLYSRVALDTCEVAPFRLVHIGAGRGRR